MSFPLQKLLTVRETREQKAARRVALCLAQIERAQREIAQHRQNQNDDQNRRRARERELEREFLGKHLPCGELESWQAQLLWHQERREASTARLDQLGQALVVRQAELASAREKHMAMRRAKEKVVKRKHIWHEESQKSEQRAEEMELEEIIRPN